MRIVIGGTFGKSWHYSNVKEVTVTDGEHGITVMVKGQKGEERTFGLVSKHVVVKMDKEEQ